MEGDKRKKRKISGVPGAKKKEIGGTEGEGKLRNKTRSSKLLQIADRWGRSTKEEGVQPNTCRRMRGGKDRERVPRVPSGMTGKPPTPL